MNIGYADVSSDDQNLTNPACGLMRTYAPVRLARGWYFFTVNLATRFGNSRARLRSSTGDQVR